MYIICTYNLQYILIVCSNLLGLFPKIPLCLLLPVFCYCSKVHLKFAAFVYLLQLLLYHIFLFIIAAIVLCSFLALLFIVSMFSMVSPKNLLVNILSFLGQQAKQQRAAPTRRRTRPHPHHLTPSPRGLVLGLLGRAFRTPTWKFNASTRWQPSSDRRRWRRRPVQMPDSRCRCPCSMFVVRCPIPNMNFPRNVVNKHINIRAGHMPQKEQQQQRQQQQ